MKADGKKLEVKPTLVFQSQKGPNEKMALSVPGGIGLIRPNGEGQYIVEPNDESYDEIEHVMKTHYMKKHKLDQLTAEDRGRLLPKYCPIPNEVSGAEYAQVSRKLGEVEAKNAELEAEIARLKAGKD